MRRMLLALGWLLLAKAPAWALSLTSGDFPDGGTIPVMHNYMRCGGENLSPALSWKGVPANAKSLVLTMIDLDVRPSLWSHWIVVNLPPSSTGLARGAPLPDGARAVASNFGDAFYDGPCPPDGSGTHHYTFTIWAMPPTELTIRPNAKAMDVQAMLLRLSLGRASITGWVRN